MSIEDDDRLTSEERLAARRSEEQRAVDEGGGGEAEGFELAEQELIDHASHGDEHGTAKISQDARAEEAEDAHETHGEADDAEPEGHARDDA